MNSTTIFVVNNEIFCRHNDAALRNTACRALIVLTDSNADLKLMFITHEATRTVLLQQISSFDDELKGIVHARIEAGLWFLQCAALPRFCVAPHCFCSCCDDIAGTLRVWLFAKRQRNNADGCTFASHHRMHTTTAKPSCGWPCCLHITVQRACWM